MRITYNKPVTKNVTKEYQWRNVLKEIYYNKRNTFIDIDYNNRLSDNDGESTTRIVIDFDEYCKEGYASTYIDLHDLYIRQYRDIDEIIVLLKKDNFI